MPLPAATVRPLRPLLDHQMGLDVLQPLVRAFILGYASSTVPRLLTLFLTSLTKRRRTTAATAKTTTAPQSATEDCLLPSLLRILRGGLEWQRFPTFCAALVGGSTLLQIPLRRLFACPSTNLSIIAQERLTRWVSSFIAAWLSLKLLQSKESAAYAKIVPSSETTSDGMTVEATRFAGRTMDLTIFAVTRAFDVLIGEFWARRKTRRMAAKKWTRIEAAVSSLTDPSIFATSCALIMWCWIYLPERLPRAYNKWISGAAAVDSRLITALNRCRWGQLIYGKDTGQAPLLQSMCVDYNWPTVWGDPTKSIPFPCEMVHMGMGKSCEYHALRRFLDGNYLAAGIYGPLNLALQLRKPSKRGAVNALVSTVRSSAFLGSFIALFYYGVCLARTRLGPYIIGTDVKSRQMIDSGICIGTGCMLCGWSILLENAGRRKDIALFVAPRALATLLPRRYEIKHEWRETALFATSTAVVFTCVQENPTRMRGVLGKVLGSVIVQ